MKRPNLNTYRARFSTLILNAFGIEQKIAWEAEIEVYQVRTSPELWRARPHFAHGNHTWEAASAESLMQIINGDFETRFTAWRKCPPPAAKPARPSLRKTVQSEQKTA